MISSLTLPIISYFSGASFNEALIDVFGSTQIEDLWIRYFSVSTNVRDDCMEASLTYSFMHFYPPPLHIMQTRVQGLNLHQYSGAFTGSYCWAAVEICTGFDVGTFTDCSVASEFL
jgi:hypothetical protein